jgi:hypothetical protein
MLALCVSADRQPREPIDQHRGRRLVPSPGVFRVSGITDLADRGDTRGRSRLVGHAYSGPKP